MNDLRSAILGANDITRERVHVPEWGVDIWIQTMSGRDRDAWEASLLVRNGKMTSGDLSLDNMRAKLLVKCIVDETGKRVFRDDEADALGAKAASVVTRLFDLAQKVNALSAQDVDELGKGLPNGPNGASGSV